MDALVLSGASGLCLIGTQSWAIWLEWWTLRGAKLRISAHDAQVAQGCRKDTGYKKGPFDGWRSRVVSRFLEEREVVPEFITHENPYEISSIPSPR